MIAHVVLFEPRADLTEAERNDFLEALRTAVADIPGVSRFRVGRRVTHGVPGYEQAMRENYQFAAIAEFEDLQSLKTYLTHPAHDELGRHFGQSSARALAYDYEISDVPDLAHLTLD